MLKMWYNIHMEKFDILIVGGGVAGMSAAIYAKRRNKNVAIIEKSALGGQVNLLGKIENFPSQRQVEGVELAQMFSKQIKALDVRVIYDEIVSAKLDQQTKILSGKKGEYSAEKVIFATGMSEVKLGKNEDEFLGRGVSFCATCDGNFFKNKPVCVIGKNGSAIKSALHLSQMCSHVTVLDEGDLSAFAKANSNKKISVISNAHVLAFRGERNLNSVVFREDEKENVLNVSGAFVDLGKKPWLPLFEGLEVDEKGFVKTDENMQTSISGVYAIGDVRNGVLKQIVTACGDGAIAGNGA